jgi:glycosyltransferase involved in cell wall biosynthesis
MGAPQADRPQISIVIPVYNSIETLEPLFERLLAVLPELDRTWEIVFVDDGSTDESWSKLRAFQTSLPDAVVAVQLMRNFGQHNALMCGFRNSRGDLVVTLDDDLQNPPEEIPKLLEAIEARELDLVYGVPDTKNHVPWRNLGSTLIVGFYRMVFRTSVMLTSFRVIRRPLLESIFPYALNFTFVDGLLAWNTQRIGDVTVEHRPRTHGRSGYSIRHLLRLAFDLFTNFSTLPLRLVSGMGIFVAFSGAMTGLYFLYRYFTDQIGVPGFASTIVTVLILGGAQLIALGVIGEYLGRLHMNVNRKPQYVERRVVRSHNDKGNADPGIPNSDPRPG